MNKKLTFALLSICAASLTASAGPLVKKQADKKEADLDTYNVKLGDNYFKAAYKLKLGYDDNVTNGATDADRQEGAYMDNGVQIALYSPIAPEFSFDTDFFFGYRTYLSGSDNDDNYIIKAGSGDTFAFNWDLNERTRISLVDRLSVTMDDSVRGVTGNSDQHFLNNDLGVQLYRELGEDSGYGVKIGQRTKSSLNDAYTFREYDETYFGALFDMKAGQKLTISPFLNYEDREWEENQNADGEKIQIGAAVKFELNEKITLGGDFGVETVDFDNGTTQDNASAEDSETGLFGSASIDHTVSEKLSHRAKLSYGRRMTSLATVNFSRDITLDYTAKYQVSSKTKVGAGLNVYQSEDQSSQGEDYTIITPKANLDFKISERMNLNLEYRYQDKSSDSDFEYDRSELSAELTYKF